MASISQAAALTTALLAARGSCAGLGIEAGRGVGWFVWGVAFVVGKG